MEQDGHKKENLTAVRLKTCFVFRVVFCEHTDPHLDFVWTTVCLASAFLWSADVPFLIVGYLKKEEVKGGQDSTSIKNVFCFETIKCLPAWLTPSSGESPLRLEQNNDYCTLPSFSLWRYSKTSTKRTKKQKPYCNDLTVWQSLRFLLGAVLYLIALHLKSFLMFVWEVCLLLLHHHHTVQYHITTM